MRYKGTITHWNDEKGFGFITPEDGSNKIFIHANSLDRRQARPQISDVISYEIEIKNKQKPSAVKISYQESPIKFSALNARINGTITDWNDERGYGFITPDGGGERIFFHVNALATGQVRPQVSDGITYEIGVDNQRRLCAIKVQHRDYWLRFSLFNFPILASIGFVTALFWMALQSIIPWWVFFSYIGASFITVLKYGWDKSKAKRGIWRTTEATLHMLEILGGWPGALVSQQVFQHKNRKISFQIQFWVIIAAHLSFWAWFLIQRPIWLTWLIK